MARIHGRAGDTLRRTLIVQLALVAGFTVLAWLVALWVNRRLPVWVVTLVVAVVMTKLILDDREIRRELRASRRGYGGERAVGRALEALPDGWRVFHDVDVGGENADHVVVGPSGAYAIEVKNYSGRVHVTPAGLYTRGERNDRVVRQAWRASHKLRERLGVAVRPILVFTKHSGGDAVGRLPVLSPDRVVPFLLAQSGTLSFGEARRVWAALEGRVR